MYYYTYDEVSDSFLLPRAAFYDGNSLYNYI